MKVVSHHAFDAAKGAYYGKYKLLATYVPELIAMKAGLRNAIQLSIAEDELYGKKIRALQDFCHKVGFHLVSHQEKVMSKVYISIAPANGIDRSCPGIENVLGSQFGYPACCVERFTSQTDRTDPLINHVHEFFKRHARFDFKMNLFLRTSPFHLYKHYPCSLTCSPTREYGARLLGVIGRENPELHDLITRFNKTPVFFTDICNVGIHLDGRKKGNQIDYNGWFYDFGPASIFALSRRNRKQDIELFDFLVEIIARGDRISLVKNKLRVTKSGKSVQIISCPAHLTWKLVDFT